MRTEGELRYFPKDTDPLHAQQRFRVHPRGRLFLGDRARAERLGGRCCWKLTWSLGNQAGTPSAGPSLCRAER